METEFCGAPKNWKDLPANPLASITEIGEGLEVSLLAQDMKQHGYNHDFPIILCSAARSIVDGRNRHAAAIQAGVQPTFKKYVGQDLQQFILRNKILRQHLSPSKRAMLVKKLLGEKSSSESPSSPIGPPRGGPMVEDGEDRKENVRDANQELADLAGVGKRTMERAGKVLETGVKELIDAVEADEITLNAAEEIAAQPPAEQKKAVVNRKKQKERKPMNIKRPSPDPKPFEILCRTMTETLQSMHQLDDVSAQRFLPEAETLKGVLDTFLAKHAKSREGASEGPRV